MSALLLAVALWLAAPEAPVADHAMRGDLPGVRALLAAGADVNVAQGDGMTALHWAAASGSVDLTRVLIDAGAALEAATRLGAYTPLQLASRSGRAGTVALLLEAGARVDPATTTGAVTALHFAAGAGSADAVRLLLARGADANARETVWGQTPLMFAAAADRVQAVEALLAGGADPSFTANVIDVAARAHEDRSLQQRREQLVGQAGHRAVTRDALVRAGYTDEPRSAAVPWLDGVLTDSIVNGVTQYEEFVGTYGGLTALLLAVREGHRASALALLAGGAELDQPSAADHTAPLLMAVVNGHFDLARELLARGADPNLASAAGDAPLFATINAHWIPRSRHPQPADHLQQETTYLELMEALLEAGADPNARLAYRLWFMEYGREFLGVDWRGATPFLRAAHALDVPAMRLLLGYGADPDIPTVQPSGRNWGGVDPSGLPPVPAGGPGVFPFHAATGAGYIYDSAGNTHRHVEDGWLPAARFFVEELGVDVNVRDFEGFTPLHNAAARGDDDLIRYLVAHGADPHLVARTGQTTVDAANGPHQRLVPFVETVKLLEGLGVLNNRRCVSC